MMAGRVFSDSDLLREINEGEARRWPFEEGVWVLYAICMRPVIDCEKPRDRTSAENIYSRRRMPRSKELGASKRFPEQIWSAISKFVMKESVKDKEYVLIFFPEDRIVFWLLKIKSNFTSINTCSPKENINIYILESL